MTTAGGGIGSINLASGGGTLRVNGTHTGGGAYAISAGATLDGTGTIGSTIGGAGLVSPGNSPGILTVAQVNPSGGTDYGFEFTATGSPTWSNASASVNDVLRITNMTTPFTTSLNGANTVSIYLNVASLTDGDTFDGGFYTDLDSDFLADVLGGDYEFYVRGDGAGGTPFNGNNYYTLAQYELLTLQTINIGVGTTQVATADFSGGTVNDGWISRFTLDIDAAAAAVPEPASVLLWTLAGLVGLAVACRVQRRSKHVK